MSDCKCKQNKTSQDMKLTYIKPVPNLTAKPTVVQQYPLQNAFPVQILDEVDLGTIPGTSGTTPSGYPVSTKPNEASPMAEKLKQLWTKTKDFFTKAVKSPVIYVIIIIAGVVYYFSTNNKKRKSKRR